MRKLFGSEIEVAIKGRSNRFRLLTITLFYLALMLVLFCLIKLNPNKDFKSPDYQGSVPQMRQFLQTSVSGKSVN